MLLVFWLGGIAQNPTGSSDVQEAPKRQLIEENLFFSVFRVRLEANSQTDIQQHGKDVVVVGMTDGLAIRNAATHETVSLNKGDAKFVKRGNDVSVSNTRSTSGTLLFVELKHYWNPEVRVCSAANCSRPIKLGDIVIGETSSLFTNGFVTAYRHHLEPGGTLTSSYFSASGKDHLLLVAITDSKTNFDGTEETLSTGQTYATDAGTVEISTLKGSAEWIVLRMQTPKPN